MPNAPTTENIETKSFTFTDIETKQTEINGIPIGVIKGMASTFGNIDLTGDRIDFGAFAKTIQAHKSRHDRPIRMFLGHDRFAGPIGGFPIDKVREQRQGLKVEGHVNLEVQRGKEAFALAQQGVLTDLSIGFFAVETEVESRGGKEVRVIKEIDLREISIVDEPANPKATITDIKAEQSAKKECILPDDGASKTSEATLKVTSEATLKVMMGAITNSINRLLLQDNLSTMKQAARVLSQLTK